jgi:hypothetical protein
LPLILLLTFSLAGCTTSDDEGDPPTEPAGATSTATSSRPTKTVASATGEALSDANGQSISDGVCQALIPDGWVDDGTGRGSTSSGGRFVLFGGHILGDAEWQTASNFVATPAAGRTIASLERTSDSIHVVFGDDRGFEYRKRFGNRYCDLAVSSLSRPIPPEEQAYWPAVIESLKPVQQ